MQYSICQSVVILMSLGGNNYVTAGNFLWRISLASTTKDGKDNRGVTPSCQWILSGGEGSMGVCPPDWASWAEF